MPPVTSAVAGFAVRVSSVTSHAPRSVWRTRRVLTCPAAASETSAACGALPIPSVRLCVCCSALCSHASPVFPTGSTLACVIVWSISPPSVFSLRTDSPIFRPLALAAAA